MAANGTNGDGKPGRDGKGTSGPSPTAGASAEEIKLEEVKAKIAYPTVYAFKVMGKQEKGFRIYVRDLFSRLLGREVLDTEIAEQPSKGARYLSVTVSVQLESEEQRRAIYGALYAETTSPEGRVKYYL